jgi:ribose transport system substrate-binding protein
MGHIDSRAWKGLAALAGGLTLLLSACGGSSGSSSGASSGVKTVGVVGFDDTSPIDENMASSSVTQLKSDGYKVMFQNAAGNTGTANQICQEYTSAHVAAIAINTFTLSAMATCVAAAKAANIPMFYEGSTLETGMAGAVDAISPTPTNDLFIKYVVQNKVTNVFTLDYSPGQPCLVRAELRSNLLLAQAPNVQVTEHQFPIPGTVADAQSATASWLEAHPAGAGKYAIWACQSESTDGALAALAQAGRTDVAIFTWDYDQTLYAAIKDGIVLGDLYLDPFGVGKQMATEINAWLKGNHTPKQVEGTTYMLTPSNVVAYIAANPIANKG